MFAKCFCRTVMAICFASFILFFFSFVLFFFKTESSGTAYCVLSLFSAIGPDSSFTVAVTQNNSTEITAASVT